MDARKKLWRTADFAVLRNFFEDKFSTYWGQSCILQQSRYINCVSAIYDRKKVITKPD